MVVLAELIRELKNLRKGRGLFASQIGERAGSALRAICDVTEEDGPAVIRQKIAATLESLAGDLPADLRIAVLAAFAICPDARMPLYQDRVNWAAIRLERDPRTARRRIDEAIDHLAQLAVVRARVAAESGSPQPATGWHTTELRVMVALDRACPEAVEYRRIVSDQDGLTELDLAVTCQLDELEVDIFYGGTLLDRGMESSQRHAFALSLPRPLALGETHDLALQFRLPHGQQMRPHFVCVPKRRCDLFDLRIRFERRSPPSRIWLLRGVFQRDVTDPVHPGEPHRADAAGEIHLGFHDLTPGLGYGARWDW